jgi:AcrR family transcriptional regulator
VNEDRSAMVQVKKASVRNAITASAYELFSKHGYHATTLQDIAQMAGTGVGSLYSYFPSKLHLLYAVVEPWQKDAFERLAARVETVANPRQRLRAILLGIWRDMPAENIGLANSHMEGLASADPTQKKPSPLLRWTEERLTRMLNGVIPARSPVDYMLLTNLFMMAYDGFVINRRLNDLRDIDRLVEIMCDIMLGSRSRQRAASRRAGGPGRLRTKQSVAKRRQQRTKR